MSFISTRSVYLKGILLLSAMIFVLATIDAVSDPNRNKQPVADDADTKALKKEWSEAVETLKKYSVNQRDQALAQAEETLETMDKRIEKLQVRAESEWHTLSKSVRERRETALRNLSRERNQLAEWYGGMKYSSDKAWEDVKQGFINAYGALSTSFGNARAEFDEDENQSNEKGRDNDEDSENKNGTVNKITKSNSGTAERS